MDDSDDTNNPKRNIFGFKKKHIPNPEHPYDDIDWDSQDDMDLGDMENSENDIKNPKKRRTSYPEQKDAREPDDYQKNTDDDTYDHEEQYKHRKFYDKDKPRNTASKVIFKTLFFIIILIISSIIILNHKSNRYRDILETPDVNRKSLADGEAKLSRPIIGDFENITNPDAENKENSNINSPDDALSHIDFDYSPIMRNTITRKPMLPNKIKQTDTSKTTSETNEFQDLWQNGSGSDLDSQTTQKSVKNMLPAWRRYAVNYESTAGLPIFSIVLEYDTDILNSADLPIYSGYNAVISGFSSEAEKNLKILQNKKIEVLLYLPMEEKTDIRNLNPIKKTSSYDAIREAIAFHTSALGGVGFVGFMNYGGSEIRKTVAKINFAMSVFTKTGFLYLDDNRYNQQSYAYAAADGQKIPALKTSTYIQSVEQEFETFIDKVKIEGTGIAIVKATPSNINALNVYEDFIIKHQVRRIPLSGILKNKILKNKL